MSKICGKCNAELEDNAAFCKNCGEKVEVAQATNEVKAQSANEPIVNTEALKAQASNVMEGAKTKTAEIKNKIQNDKNLQKMIIGVLVAIIVLLVLFKFIMPSPKSVLKTYCSGVKSFNANKIVKTYHPDFLKKMDEYAEDYMDADSFKDYLKEQLKDQKDEDYKVLSYDIDWDYDKLDKDEVEERADEIEDAYDIDAKKIKAIREYKVKFKVSEDGDKETNKETITLVKVGFRWYIFGV